MKFVKKSDIIIIVIILAVFITIYFLRPEKEDGDTVIVTVNNEVTHRYSLHDENMTFSPDGLPNVMIEIEDGKAHFSHSDCPDKVCIHTGWISKTGEYAACLPNGVVIYVNSSEAAEYDIIL